MLLLVRLKFKSAFKIGGGETTQTDEFQGIIHSDTLFSALLNEWVRLYPARDITALIEDVPFRLSSAFPYYLNNYYLPTPLGTSRLYMEKLKDIPFLELYDFLDLASGNNTRILSKELKNPLDEMLFNQTVPRVTVDRMTAATNIFESSGWVCKDGGGFYFLVALRDEDIRLELELCLKMLGQSGLGADRNVGYGLFESEIENIDNITPWPELFNNREAERTAFCALSLIHPSKEEAKDALSYRLLKRQGWIFSRSSAIQMKRRACMMFAEGSLFRNQIEGQMANVTPSEFNDHQVFRYGLGMMVIFAGETET